MTDTWVVDARPDDVARISYNDQGLVPVIAQEATTREVLMVAWADREALLRTLTEGRVTYFSRSRQEYWRKGDQSGNIQVATRLHVDCDGDVVLLQVNQTGPSCHTGQATCFDREADQ
jgi:phosphoribosyl-AMP cyclohydrolase